MPDRAEAACLRNSSLATQTGPFTCERLRSGSTMIIDPNSEDCPLSAGSLLGTA
jgi:hypothetical protein